MINCKDCLYWLGWIPKNPEMVSTGNCKVITNMVEPLDSTERAHSVETMQTHQDFGCVMGEKK